MNGLSAWQEIGFGIVMLAIGLLLECYIDVWRERRRERRDSLYPKAGTYRVPRGDTRGGHGGAERAQSGGYRGPGESG